MERLLKLQKKVTFEKNDCRRVRKECERVIQKWDDMLDDFSKDMHAIVDKNMREAGIDAHTSYPAAKKEFKRLPLHKNASLPGRKQHYLPRSMSRGSVCL